MLLTSTFIHPVTMCPNGEKLTRPEVDVNFQMQMTCDVIRLLSMGMGTSPTMCIGRIENATYTSV